MTRLVFGFCISLTTFSLAAQSPSYATWVRAADSLFQKGEARAAAETYSAAFATLGWKGRPDDRYSAARAWALAGVADSAFFQLNRLVDKSNFRDEAKLLAEADFEGLKTDFRWMRLLTQIQMRKDKAAALRNDPLVLELEEIHRLDQWYRIKRDSVVSAHGGTKTAGYQAFFKDWVRQDSLNILRISEILGQRGWLGPDDVGDYASKAFYLVIQHADLPVQERYFPLMKKAVADGKASAADLAYLEDRILMRQGKPQRYGSQVRSDKVTGEWILHEVEDPANLDKRRASVGLSPIAEYLSMMGAKWKQ